MPRKAVKEVISWLQSQLKRKKANPKRSPALPLFGLDGETVPSVSALRASGVHFFVGYLSTVGNPKNIDKAGIRRLREANAKVVLVFETTAARAREGLSAGVADARSAIAQAAAIGAPKGVVIYFAVDYEAEPGEIVEYFIGVKKILAGRTGVYARYSVVKYLLDHKIAWWAWQTLAWSNGLVETRAVLYQFSVNHIIGGVGVDFDHARSNNYGQW